MLSFVFILVGYCTIVKNQLSLHQKVKQIDITTDMDTTFNYMLLGRLISDCKYFLGNGNGYEKDLWAGSVQKQIAKMKEAFWGTLIIVLGLFGVVVINILRNNSPIAFEIQDDKLVLYKRTGVVSININEIVKVTDEVIDAYKQENISVFGENNFQREIIWRIGFWSWKGKGSRKLIKLTL